MSRIKNGFDRLKRFLREVRSELRKVTWPTRDQVKSYSLIVASVILTLTVLLWLADSLFSQILKLIIR